MGYVDHFLKYFRFFGAIQIIGGIIFLAYKQSNGPTLGFLSIRIWIAIYWILFLAIVTYVWVTREIISKKPPFYNDVKEYIDKILALDSGIKIKSTYANNKNKYISMKGSIVNKKRNETENEEEDEFKIEKLKSAIENLSNDSKIKIGGKIVQEDKVEQIIIDNYLQECGENGCRDHNAPE